MGWPAAVMAGATVVQAVGQMKANADQAQEELENSRFYGEQADFAKKAGERQEAIFTRQADYFINGQGATIARSGSDSSGSALTAITDSLLKKREQIDAIRSEAAMNERLARLRAEASATKAGRVSDLGNNALQAGTTILNNYSSFLRSQD